MLRYLATAGLGLALSLGAPAISTQAEVLFQDSFESGDFSHSENGISWTRAVKVSISEENASWGDKAARFFYEGSSSLTSDAWAELAFDLNPDHKIKEIWIRYDLFIPANYQHRVTGGSENNKGLAMLWGETYTAPSVRSSFNFWPSEFRYTAEAADAGDSFITTESTRNGWSTGHRWSKEQGRDDFRTGIDVGEDSRRDTDDTSDAGRWVAFYLAVRLSDVAPYPAEQARGNGMMGVWKCTLPCGLTELNRENALVYNDELNNWADSDARNFLEHGYLLGWANSGFDEDTVFYMDNVVFATSKEDLLQLNGEPATPDLLGTVEDTVGGLLGGLGGTVEVEASISTEGYGPLDQDAGFEAEASVQ